MADETITDDDQFDDDLTYFGYMLDGLEHGCHHHPRAVAGDRSAQRRRLDEQIYDTRYHWPHDHAAVLLANWAARRDKQWETSL